MCTLSLCNLDPDQPSLSKKVCPELSIVLQMRQSYMFLQCKSLGLLLKQQIKFMHKDREMALKSAVIKLYCVEENTMEKQM